MPASRETPSTPFFINRVNHRVRIWVFVFFILPSCLGRDIDSKPSTTFETSVNHIPGRASVACPWLTSRERLHTRDSLLLHYAHTRYATKLCLWWVMLGT
ncbi:hypothetical protein GE21DRAFT_1280168 [Neurospora crassa]|nr:hypothetical protein GE21DRAFT_1280168 [Neurospora crassa]